MHWLEWYYGMGRIYSQVQISLLLAVVPGLFEATILCFLSKETIFYMLLQVFAFSHKDMHAAFSSSGTMPIN